jgi:hypothetical protein
MITMALKSRALWLASWFAIAVLALTVVELPAEQAPRPSTAAQPSPGTIAAESASPGETRQREGVTFDQEGFVQFTGERMTFISLDGQHRLVMLENLALDRVGRSVRDSTAKTRWKVTGTITEYQGSNYLLLGRAVLVHRDDDLGS